MLCGLSKFRLEDGAVDGFTTWHLSAGLFAHAEGN